ncbi:MAG: hypothetical protein HOP08_07675 [Cyclobacteriaceae bacterium]|nr:hypothetical protein [Cyclobacteriaceae bacterium]
MFSRVFILALLLIVACDRDLSDDPIPIVPFADFTINIYFPEYQVLNNDGGFKQFGNLGVRGVIVYRNSASNYSAYEVNCSYHPNEAGSNITIHPSNLYMQCGGCGSTFGFTDGMPTGGIAWRPLRKYRTEFNSPNLTIINEIAN